MVKKVDIFLWKIQRRRKNDADNKKVFYFFLFSIYFKRIICIYIQEKRRENLSKKEAEAKAVVFLIKTCCISRSSRRFLVFLRRMLPCLRLIRFSLLFKVSFRSFGSFYHKDAFPFLSFPPTFTSLRFPLLWFFPY